MTRSERLLTVLGQVDDRYIEEAAPGREQLLRPARHPGRRVSAALLAALIALCLMGAGVVAALCGDSIQSWFGQYWEAVTGQTMSREQRAVIDHLSQEIGLSRTVGDVTVTVDSATVGDDNFFLLLRVKGLSFSKKYNYGFDAVDMEVAPDPLEETGGLGSYGFQYLGLDESGAALMLMDHLYTSTEGHRTDTSPLKVMLTLEDLARNGHTNKRKLLTEGVWSFEFTLDRSQPPETRTLPDTVALVEDLDKRETVSVAFTDIELTSTGLRFCYDYREGTLAISGQVSVVLKNGMTVSSGSGGGTPQADGSTLNCSYQWQVPVDLNEAAALQIGSTRIPVLPGK